MLGRRRRPHTSAVSLEICWRRRCACVLASCVIQSSCLCLASSSVCSSSAFMRCTFCSRSAACLSASSLAFSSVSAVVRSCSRVQSVSYAAMVHSSRFKAAVECASYSITRTGQPYGICVWQAEGFWMHTWMHCYPQCRLAIAQARTMHGCLYASRHTQAGNSFTVCTQYDIAFSHCSIHAHTNCELTRVCSSSTSACRPSRSLFNERTSACSVATCTPHATGMRSNWDC